MKPWSKEAADHVAQQRCFWSPCGPLLQVAAEEIARRAGHQEVEIADWQHALEEVTGDGPRSN